MTSSDWGLVFSCYFLVEENLEASPLFHFKVAVG